MPFGGGLMLAGDSRNFRVDLVNSGNAAFEGSTSSLDFVFTGTQRAGGAR